MTHRTGPPSSCHTPWDRKRGAAEGPLCTVTGTLLGITDPTLSLSLHIHGSERRCRRSWLCGEYPLSVRNNNVQTFIERFTQLFKS